MSVSEATARADQQACQLHVDEARAALPFLPATHSGAGAQVERTLPEWRPSRESCPAGHAGSSVPSMPTFEHNALVEMFRENPELAPHLLALLFHVDVPPHASVGVVESSLDQLIPVEFRAHGNGPNGLAVVQAALVALAQLDREHAAVYFQIIWNALREPMQRALEALVMERQAEGETKFPPFVQRIFEQGIHEGELKGRLEGELKGKRDTLLRLLARAGITLTEDEAARVKACEDPALLDRWVDNVLGAKTASDVLS